MRIWHQGFIEMATVPAYAGALERHLRAVAGPETVVDVHGVAPRTYTPHHTAADIARSPYLMSLHVHQILDARSEEHTSELQSRLHLVCRLLLEKKKESKQDT